MFGVETEAFFAQYFQKYQSQFSQCTVLLIYIMFSKFFFIFLVFITKYPIFWQLLMDIIFGYPLIGQFDTS